MYNRSSQYASLTKKANICSRLHSYFLISPNARIYNAKLHYWFSIEDERRRHLDSYPWTVHPYSSFRWYWMMFMLVVLIFSLIGRRPFQPHDWIFYGLTSAVFLVDIVLHFRTGYPLDLQHSSKVAELNPNLIAKHYARSWFIVDGISAIPFDLVCSLLSGSGELLPGVTISLRLLKLFRLARILYYGTKILKVKYDHTEPWSQEQMVQQPQPQQPPCHKCFPPAHHFALRRFEFDDGIVTIEEGEEESEYYEEINVALQAELDEISGCPLQSVRVSVTGSETDGSNSSGSQYDPLDDLACNGIDSAV